MIRLIRFLITGSFDKPHRHTWDVYQNVDVLNNNYEKVASKFILRCTECGEMKSFTLRS